MPLQVSKHSQVVITFQKVFALDVRPQVHVNVISWGLLALPCLFTRASRPTAVSSSLSFLERDRERERERERFTTCIQSAMAYEDEAVFMSGPLYRGQQ